MTIKVVGGGLRPPLESQPSQSRTRKAVIAPEDKTLDSLRLEIDRLDEMLLDVLAERNERVAEVAAIKVEQGLPVFAADRERNKSRVFRQQAEARGLDPDWAEDFLRMVMAAARAAQSRERFARATTEPRRILVVGGAGRMGRLYRRMAAASRHDVRVLEPHDAWPWPPGEPGPDLAIISVPVARTPEVIHEIAPWLSSRTVLADFTSHKVAPVNDMLAAHPGPVLGLHPMHGPDVSNLSRQLMIACPGRRAEAGEWFLEQCRLWGMRVLQCDPEEHDRVMDLVQGLRHFLVLMHGVFLRKEGLPPGQILEYSSPVYRAELMMTGRIFAQPPQLYADVVFSSDERRRLILRFLEGQGPLAELVRNGDREGFVEEFRAVGEFFGDFAGTALEESGYLVHRLTDRFG